MQKQQKQLFGSLGTQNQQFKFCPICHQDITYQTPIYQCKKICKNFFHTKCLKFWVKHQRKTFIQNQRYDQQTFQHRSSILVNCPMCRTNFPQNIQNLILQSQKTFKKYYQLHPNIKCNECNQEIYLKIFHCLLCKNINICQKCYINWKHNQHDRFLMKYNKKSEWQVPISRTKVNMVKLQFDLQYIKKVKQAQSNLIDKNIYKNNEITNEPQIKQLFGQNYQKFLQSKLPKPDLINYLKQSMINMQKQIHKTYKAVDYNSQTLKCIACKKSNIIQMKRMYCKEKHFIDQKCLNFFLKNNFLQCPIDKGYILEGLETIKINFKVNAKPKTK